MFVYSEKIISFVLEIKKNIQVILSKEVGLRVTPSRFFDESGRFSYPLSIVIYNDRRELGYFDPNFYELGFHECLMNLEKKVLCDVIRHELAHYLTFIRYGYEVEAHGAEFRAFCLEMGWGKEVYLSTMHLPQNEPIISDEERDVLRKVQKLMALSQSSNQNEAESAVLKSQQLLLKHNLQLSSLESSIEEKVFLERILKQTRKNAKMQAIAKILECFFVSVVFHKASEGTYLEILGTALNVQIAEHVAAVLDTKFEDLWNQAQKEHKLKGMRSRNSFFLGIAKGYCQKVRHLQNEHLEAGLVLIENSLERARTMAYRRLSYSASQARFCKESSQIGEIAGKNLNISPALSKAADFLSGLIGLKARD